MIGLLLVLAVIAAMFALAIRREALWTWAVLLAVVTLFIKLGLFAGTLHVPSFTAWALSGWLPAIVLGVLSWRPARRVIVTHPVFGMIKRVLPPVSKTEQEALDAGTHRLRRRAVLRPSRLGEAAQRARRGAHRRGAALPR